MTLLTSSNAPQASNQSNAATPPVGNHLQFTNKNFYYHMGEAVPRRPAYSTSRVEINIKPNPISIAAHNNQDFFDANTYLKLEQPISSTRFSDQTRLRTGNYLKNFNTNLVRSNHFSSSENLTAHSINPKSSRMKVLKLLQETRNEDDEILYRKSAFQAIDSSKNLISSSEHMNQQQHHQQQQQQIVPSLSSGTSSTTSSISYSATSQCLSNSNSANNSLCLSKSSENVNRPVGQNTAALTKSTLKIAPDTQIRSGSVSSARSIYELRLKRYFVLLREFSSMECYQL